MNITEYDQQAIDFLKKTNAALSITYKGRADRFESGQATDVYQVTLMRNGESYTFDFSQSIAKSERYEIVSGHINKGYCALNPYSYFLRGHLQNEGLNVLKSLASYRQKYHGTVPVEEGGNWVDNYKKKSDKHTKWNEWIDKLMVHHKGEKPTEYDILAYLSVYEFEDLQDFINEFGYGADQIRRAQRDYQAVREESNELKYLFNEEELEMLNEIA